RRERSRPFLSWFHPADEVARRVQASLLQKSFQTVEDVKWRSGIVKIGRADLDGRRARQEILNGVFSCYDAAGSNDRYLNRARTLVNHSQRNRPDRWTGEAAGHGMNAWFE